MDNHQKSKTMKKIITTLALVLVSITYGQVIIGDEVGTATDKTSVLLEFANDGDKGLILPYVKVLPSSPTPGTILLDASIPATARVKYFKGGVNQWVDLTGRDHNMSSALSAQPDGIVETTSKAIIGATSSAADGVLVLESTTKAMVLPHVPSTDAVLNPSPGMMVYVKGVSPDFNKRLAVFNGSTWSYWKP